MSTTAPDRTSGFNSARLRSEIARLRQADNFTNLGYLAFEYLCLAIVVGGSVAFAELRGSWGLAWGWNVPVFALAIVLMGGLLHRLAGLGHEASHYSLLKNKWANDLVGDLFCLFPVMATIPFYRLFHMAHHQYTNDPELDPDLVNLGPGKQVEAFPMGRWRFIVTRLFAPLVSPVSFVLFQLEYFYVNVIGKGNNVYMRRVLLGDAARSWPRVGTWLGMAYLVGVLLGQWVLRRWGLASWLVPAGLLGVVAVAVVMSTLPERWVFQSPFRQPYSARLEAVIRMAYYTSWLVGLGVVEERTGSPALLYLFLLWLLPIATSFAYFMLLRDTYQHTNADDGRLTNTRVFFCDPLTRWAVFVYGQDMHVPHHLFPVVPHYRLERLHRLLQAEQADYAREVVEVHGTFANDRGLPTVLDVLTEPRPTENPNRGASGAGGVERPATC